MKVLVINSDTVGESLAFCLRCVKAGHEVRLFLAPGNNMTTGDGFRGITKVGNWVASMMWADVVFVTGNHLFLPRLDAFRKRGVKVFGPSSESAALEIKREQGMKFLEKHGIECPAYKTFPNLDAAEAHVRKTGARFVFKTLGDEEDKSLSYCAKNAADMVARIQRWKKLKLASKGQVMLQEFIEGTEFAVSRWMGAKGFIGLPNENWEYKKLLSGNSGPNCGESGTVMKYVSESKLYNEMLKPLEAALVRMGHLGDIDVNCIIDEKGKAWPLEFTMRPGWPAMNIMLHEHTGDPVQWMADACDGEDTLEVTTDHAVGIVLAQPDYPYSSKTKAETDGIPVYGMTSAKEKYVHAQAIKMAPQPVMDGEAIVEKPQWTTTGDYICVVSGLGKSVRQAADRAYKTLGELDVSDGMYRDDIGESLEKHIPKIQAHGYATEFRYT